MTTGDGNPRAGLINTCTVSNDDGDNAIDIPEPDVDVESTFLDAGNSISISSNGSDYLTLMKAEVAGSGFIFYSTGAIKGALKPGLKVTVPGAGFPAFSDIAVADVGGFKLTSPSNGSAIRFDTQLVGRQAVISMTWLLLFPQVDLTTRYSASQKIQAASNSPRKRRTKWVPVFSVTSYRSRNGLHDEG